MKFIQLFFIFILSFFWVTSSFAACDLNDIMVFWDLDKNKEISGKRGVFFVGQHDLPIYDDALSNAKPIRLLPFPSLKQNFYVKDVRRGDKNEFWLQLGSTNTNIKGKWVNTRNKGVLCSTQAIFNKATYLQKKVVVAVSSSENHTTFLYNKPHGTQLEHPIRIMDYFFVYAEHDNWLLLGEIPPLSSRYNRLVGWVKKEQTIEWNTRKVIKPKSDRDVNFFQIASDGKMIDVVNKVLKKNTGEDKWQPSDKRPLVLAENLVKDAYKVISLDVVQSKKLDKHIRDGLEAYSGLNVIFLVDGTESTLEYIDDIHQSMGSIHEEITRQVKSDFLKEKITEVNYGLVSYTDTAYLNELFKIRVPLTTNLGMFKSGLDKLRKETKKISSRRQGRDDHLEDMFNAIKQLSLSNEFNNGKFTLLILLTDMGSHSRSVSLEETKRAMNVMRKRSPFVIMALDAGSSSSTDLDNDYCTRVLNNKESYKYINDVKNCSHFTLEAQLGSDQLNVKRYEITQISASETITEFFENYSKELIMLQKNATGLWRGSPMGGRNTLIKQSFIDYLIANGIEKQTLTDGLYAGGNLHWVKKSDVELQYFMTASEMNNWATILKTLGDEGNWATSSVINIIKQSVDKYAREDIQNIEQLSVVELFRKMLGFTAGNESWLHRQLQNKTLNDYLDFEGNPRTLFLGSLLAYGQRLNELYRGYATAPLVSNIDPATRVEFLEFPEERFRNTRVINVLFNYHPQIGKPKSEKVGYIPADYLP